MNILVPCVLPKQKLCQGDPMYGINTLKAVEDSTKVSVRVCERIRIRILWLRICKQFSFRTRTNAKLSIYQLVEWVICVL